MLDLRALEAFIEIARTGSFRGAADVLNLAQASVSERMRGLEREVGGRLFLRQGRGVALTEQGHAPPRRKPVASVMEFMRHL